MYLWSHTGAVWQTPCATTLTGKFLAIPRVGSFYSFVASGFFAGVRVAVWRSTNEIVTGKT